MFFPKKAEVPSDSEEVRKYSGVHGAGRETNPSVAFGYAPEAHNDSGILLMFVPVFKRLWATMLGVSLGFVVYLGLPVLILDRVRLIKYAKETRESAELLFTRPDRHRV